MKEKKILFSTISGIVFYAGGIWMLIQSLLMCKGEDIWFDELFSVTLPTHSFADMLSLAAKDVHPPLYYMILKIAFLIRDGMGLTGLSNVAVAKAVSLLPYIILFFFSIVALRKVFGMFTSGLFIFCLLGMPQMPAFQLEIRMYSWTMLFVTLSFYTGYLILEKEEHVKRNFFLFFLYGIAGAYCHYFGLLTIFLNYLYLAVGLLWRHRKVFRLWMFAVVASILSYLPWLAVFYQQVRTVKGSYWIPPVSLRTFGGCAKFLLWPNFEKNFLNYMTVFLITALILWSFMTVVFKRKKDVRMLVGIGGMCILIDLVILAVVLSLLIRPIFVYRYMIPALGVFYLGFAICAGVLMETLCENVKWSTFLFIGLLIVLLPVGVRQYHLFQWEETKKLQEMEHTIEALQEIEQDAVLLFNFNQVQAILWHYLPNESYLWGWTDELLIGEICEREPVNMTTEIEDLKAILEENETVYYFGTGTVRKEILELWDSNGIKSEMIKDSCLLERYWINIYKLRIN